MSVRLQTFEGLRAIFPAVLIQPQYRHAAKHTKADLFGTTGKWRKFASPFSTLCHGRDGHWPSWFACETFVGAVDTT